MIRRSSTKWDRAILPVVITALLVTFGSPSAYSQRRTARRPQTKQTTQTTKATQIAQPVQPLTIYDRGYLKAYNEGFAQGQADWGQGVPRDFQRTRAYQQRDQSYEQGMSTSEEYTQGYQLGFELGYNDGYYGRARNTATPTNALTLAKAAALADAQRAAERAAAERAKAERRDMRGARGYSPASIPNDTDMVLRLITPINTKTNRTGDRFTAIVMGPPDFDGATVEGHIATLNRSGRITGKTEMVLAFDGITLRDGRQGPLNADVVKILDSDKVKKVDQEGRIETGNRTRESEVRGGVGAGAGAVIGALAGGAKGALIGLLVGGAAGVGTVAIEGNNDLILDNGAEIVIRTAGRRQP